MTEPHSARCVRRGIVAITGFVILLAGCPAPFDDSIVERVTDEVAPSLDIAAPDDGSTYTETMVVTGTVADGDVPAAGRVTVSYDVRGVLGSLTTGTVGTIESDGSFEFSFDTISFTGDISLLVTATDWNSNATTVTVALHAPVYPLPSFTASADNQLVTVSWAPIPGATGYTLRYTDNGSLPTDTYGTAVPFVDARTDTDPYEITDAVNGNLYVLRLEVETPQGTLTSGYRSVVPLSQFTLAPLVEGGYQKIDLEWPSIPATSLFEVWRAETRDGTYINYSGTVTGTEYTDVGVTANQVYYYKVRPVLEGAQPSGANSGVSHPFPDTVQARRSEELLPGSSETIAATGDIVVVGAGTDGIHIVDVSDPDNPAYITTYTRPDIDVVGVVAMGDFVYIADAQTSGSSTDGEILAIDLTTPSLPTLADSIAIDDPVSIAVTDDYIFVNDSNTIIRFVLIEDPYVLTLMAQTWTTPLGSPAAIAAMSYALNPDYDLLFVIDTTEVSTYYSHVHMVLISDRSLSTTPDPSTSSSWTYDSELIIQKMAATTDNLCLMSMVPFALEDFYYYVEVLDVPSMDLVGTTADDFIIGGGLANLGTIASGNRFFVGNRMGVRMFSIADETNPVPIDYWDTPGPAQEVVVVNNYIYAASGNLGIQGVDLTAPGNFQQTGYYDVVGVNDVALDGAVAYLAAADGTLRAVDASGTDELALVDSVPVGTTALSVALSGDYAVVATGSEGVTVVDISDPSDLSVVGSDYQTSVTSDVSIYGDYAYVASSAGLQVFHISDPTQPEFCGFFDSLVTIHRVDVRGSVAYVTESGYFDPNRLYLLDISSPETPVLIDEFTHGMQVYDIVVRDGYAFMSDNFPGGGGLQIVDVDPGRGTYGTSIANLSIVDGWDEAIDAITNYVFLGSDDETLSMRLIDTSDMGSIDDTSIIDGAGWTSADPQEIVQWNNYVFVADANNGLLVFDALPGE